MSTYGSAGVTRVEHWPGRQLMAWAEPDGSERVLEFHHCDLWEFIDSRYRCGRLFGDGERCDRTEAVPSSFAYNQRTYARRPA